MDAVRQPLDGEVMWLKTEIHTLNRSLKYNMRIIADLGYSSGDLESLDFTRRRTFIKVEKIYTPHNGHLKQILSNSPEVDTRCHRLRIMIQYENADGKTVIGQIIYFSPSPLSS